MSRFVKLLGESLLSSGKNTVKTANALENKRVCLYFSAHWCPPCRGFTPELAKYYTSHKDKFNFETVFISSDREESAFDEYFGEMPWLALPFGDRERKAQLSKKFKVSSIPSLVVLDSDGSTITTKARNHVLPDPEGFPWEPKTVDDMLGKTLLTKGGEVQSADAIRGKKLAIYFSAHWCPPCRAFTPQLAKTYNKLKETHKDDFELNVDLSEVVTKSLKVFVSSDRDENSFKEYFVEMPWLALPYDRRDAKNELSEHFEVEGIPTLVMMDESRKIITSDARTAVMSDPEGKDFPWYPKPLNDVSKGEGIAGLNESPSLLILMEAAAQPLKDNARQALGPIAEAAQNKRNKGEEDDKDVLFFIATEDTDLTQKLRKMMNLSPPSAGSKRVVCSGDMCSQVDGTEPIMLLIDVQNDLSFYLSSSTSITSENIRQFISDFKEGNLEKQKLSV